MKIFAIASGVPFKHHDQPGVTAVNIVEFELLNALVGLGHQITLQIVFNSFRETETLGEKEEDALRDMRQLGVSILTPVFSKTYLGKKKSVSLFERIVGIAKRQFLGAKIEDYYPALRVRALVCERIHASNADSVLALWSPEGLASSHGCCVPRIAYQGDVDFMPAQAWLNNRALFLGDESGVRHQLNAWRRKRGLELFKQAHFELMRDVDVIANVTASNVDVYSQRGHPRSIYIRNTWSDAGFQYREQASGQTIKIIGHVGYLNRTGSTFGLKFLLADAVPLLPAAMRGLDYQVHIIGGGELVPSLKSWAKQERVVMRGYVEDLDSELRSADIFLLLNNAGSYYAAYTRHLVAWAMGSCLIVHSNSQKAIPEIAHMENALVGSTPEDIARMIYLAATDRELNRRVRAGGRATYEKYFTPHGVAQALSDEIARAVSEKK